MDRTTGIIIFGAIGLMLLSLTFVDRNQWTNDWLPPQIMEEITRIGATLRPEQGKVLKVNPPATAQPAIPVNSGFGPTSGYRLGISGE